ncbi:hypothetical protein F92_07705 [Francisella tularensis subsp. holarctica F92]|nr:hypothetical protein F92_07705 [Francisella tularensis subsp. holarctica F92]
MDNKYHKPTNYIYIGTSENPLKFEPEAISATKKYNNILAIMLSLLILAIGVIAPKKPNNVTKSIVHVLAEISSVTSK